MIPGPDLIIACPHCQGLAAYMTLSSGNTFGARFWTDGKQVAPMLPQPPAVVKCRHCPKCYWLSQASQVGSRPMWEQEDVQIDPAWAAARRVTEPTQDQYYEAIDNGLARNKSEERDLRVLAMWRRNDALRDAPAALPGPEKSPACRKNLEALSDLLDEGDENDGLMRAEVLRELGQFEAARQVLDRVRSPEYSAVVRQIRSLCDAGDACVRELNYQDEEA